MLPLRGFVGRLANAVLAAIIAFLFVYLIAILAESLSSDFSATIKRFDFIIALLVGIVYYVSKPAPVV